MEKFGKWLIKNKILLILTLVLIVLSIVGTIFLMKGDKINSDMLVYLPKDTETAEGIEFLKENFGVKGDAFVVVEGKENDKALEESVIKIRGIEGVTQFAWYGDVQLFETLAKLANMEDKFDADGIKQYLKRPILDDSGAITGYNYVLLVLIEYSPSTKEAFAVHKQIRSELSDNLGRSVAISGMTALADTVFTATMKEIPFYLIFAVIAVLLILFLATDSFLDPFILMLTLGVSVLINMGSNLIFKNISIISFAASSVLQLGITMDYAIFLMHTYKEERLSLDPFRAVSKALPRTFMNIFASGLTTIGGFAALYFMRFTIGRDIANVIIKGIILSMATVLILQPCFLIYFDKMMGKTRHKTLKVNFEPVAKTVLKGRYVIAIIAVLLLIPAFFGQAAVQFSYLKIYKESENKNAQEILASELQNQVIMAVPLIPKEGSHEEFMADIADNAKFNSVLGAFSSLKMTPEEVIKFLELPLVKDVPLVKLLFQYVPENEGGQYYTLYLLGVGGDTEDAEAFAAHAYLSEKLDRYFGKSYPLGVLTGTADMAKVTPKDFLWVTLISAGIILVVMSFLLKSVTKSVLMVVLIELAIWINISINTIFHIPLNFMIYIIISSVQLGCTVDYAILLNSRFEEAKLQFSDTRTAIVKATSSAFPAITTSVAVICATCLSIFFVSRNLLVKEMAAMLTRGALVSYVLIIFVLPCLLLFFKKIKPLKKKKETEEKNV